jgi:hypothetical protein
MFITKTKMAMQSILRIASEETNSKPLPTNLSIIRDDTRGHLIANPKEVIAQVQKLVTQALSPDPTLPPSAPFPWLSHVSSSHKQTIHMTSGCITPAIMQEALRRTPNHKAAGPDGVPRMLLKHMPPAFHEGLHLLFQTMSIMGITLPSWLHSLTILLYKKETPPH